MTLDIRSEGEKFLIAYSGHTFSGSEEAHAWLLEHIESLCRKVREDTIDEAAELCRRKYPCADPGHDDRWCVRCRAIEDGADMLEEEILSLKSRNERSSK